MDKIISELITKTANESAQEWSKEQGPKIRLAIRKRLDADKSKVISALCDKLADKIASGISVHVTISDC